MTVIFDLGLQYELDNVTVKINHYAKYLGYLVLKLLSGHIGPIALSGLDH